MVTNVVSCDLKVQIFMLEALERVIKSDSHPDDFLLLNNYEKLRVAENIDEFIHNFINQIITKKGDPYFMENLWKWIYCIPYLYYFGQGKYDKWSPRIKCLPQGPIEEVKIILKKTPSFAYCLIETASYEELAKMIIDQNSLLEIVDVSQLLIKMTTEIPYDFPSKNLYELVESLREFVLNHSNKGSVEKWNDTLKIILQIWTKSERIGIPHVKMFMVLFTIVDITDEINENIVKLMQTQAKIIYYFAGNNLLRYDAYAEFMGLCLKNFHKLDKNIYESFLKDFKNIVMDTSPEDCLGTFVNYAEYFPEEANDAMLNKVRDVMKNINKKSHQYSLARFVGNIKSMILGMYDFT